MDLADTFLRKFSHTLYFHLFPERLVGRAVAEADFDTAELTADFEPSIVRAAFGHERIIVGSRDAAEKVFGTMVRMIHGKRGFVKPFVVLHLEQIWEHKITDPELFCLFDLLDRSGSRSSRIWIGRELKDEEIRARRFPVEGTLYYLAGDPSQLRTQSPRS